MSSVGVWTFWADFNKEYQPYSIGDKVIIEGIWHVILSISDAALSDDTLSVFYIAQSLETSSPELSPKEYHQSIDGEGWRHLELTINSDQSDIIMHRLGEKIELDNRVYKLVEFTSFKFFDDKLSYSLKAMPLIPFKKHETEKMLKEAKRDSINIRTVKGGRT